MMDSARFRCSLDRAEDSTHSGFWSSFYKGDDGQKKKKKRHQLSECILSIRCCATCFMLLPRLSFLTLIQGGHYYYHLYLG